MMKTVKMIRKHDQRVIASKTGVADHYWSRLKGLIGRTEFHEGEALLLPRCNSIHMWMMQIPIDAVFLKKTDQEWMVMSLHADLKPWKPLPVGNLKADDVLELPAGSIERLGMKSGEVLCIGS
jgi:uncharacterized membrane protein (UPF0127 family)